MLLFIAIAVENLLPFLFIGVILTIFAVSYFFHEKQVILRELRKTKAKSMLRISNGEYVKIIGKALYVNELIQAPISLRKCILYQTKVKQKQSKNSWSTIIDETSKTDFFIEVKGETAIVSLGDSKGNKKIYLEKDKKENSGVWNDPNDRLKVYLQKHNEKATSWLGFNKTMKYHEGIIENGEMIVIKGIAQWKQLSEPINGYGYSKILTITGNTQNPLIITDLKKAQIEKK